MDIEDTALPASASGETPTLPPASLSPRQEELCARLDSFHALYGLIQMNPSQMFRGVVFAARQECRSNPDWIAQAANSLREVLYPFYSKHVAGVPADKKEILEKYGSVRPSDKLIERMGNVYGRVQDLAHHGNLEKNHTDFSTFSPTDFEGLLSEYEETMLDVLSRQIDIHTEIDDLLKSGPPPETL